MAKRQRQKETRSARAAHDTRSAATPRLPDKYAGATFFDPATRTLRSANGDAATRAPEPTPVSSVGATGSKDSPPIPYLDRLYACETADRETIERLAVLAGCTFRELEEKRCGWSMKQAEECPPGELPDRRRCWNCPHADDDDIPF